MSEHASTGTHPPRIVVGIDDAPAARSALRWALRVAQTEQATVDAITAWHIPAVTYPAHPHVTIQRTPHEQAEAALVQVVTEVCGSAHPQNVRLRTLEGSAADVLVEAGRDALMLVVGSRGLGPARGMLLGSVSLRVAERASCPVLVVHPERDAA